MKNLIGVIVILIIPFFVFGPTAAQPQQTITSIYTDVSAAKCKTIMFDKETGNSLQSCPGVAGYKLLVEGDDNRMSIRVMDSQGKQHPLDYWEVITHAFSYVGTKAEWRVFKKNGQDVPIALIMRVNVSENPDEPKKITSYLAVAKITPEDTCVTDKIKPSKTANEEARRAADASANKPCLQRR